MIRLRYLRRWGGGRDFARGLRPGGAWCWRPASSVMLAVIVGILLVLPSADAGASRQAAAHATSGTSQARPTLNVVVVGDLFSYGYARSADPVLRLSVPPTLAALNQVQLAAQDVQIHVLFIPVGEATWVRLYKRGGGGKPPLINALKGANVVIAGVGADVPAFATSLRKILFGSHVPVRSYAPLARIFKNGSYQQGETAFLGTIAASEAPGGAIVTLGYPQVQRVGLSSGRTWWSALSWSKVSGRQARLTNRLVAALDTGNAAATKATGTHYQAQHLLYADPSAMPSGAGSRGAQATALKIVLIGNTLLPYVTQAVNDELSSIGLQGSRNVAPITPTSRWVLSVQLPTGTRAPLPHRGSAPGNRAASPTGVAPTRQRLTNTQGNGGNNGRRPVAIPVPIIPAPPAPIPKPIAPLVLPKPIEPRPTGGGGTSPTAAGGGSPAQAGASPSGSQPGGTGTTSSGGGTTSPGGGSTSSGGGTSSSWSPSSSSSPSGSSAGSPSSGASSWSGGGLSGGGSVS